MARHGSRQEVYEPLGAGGSVTLPGAPRASAPPEIESAGSRLLGLAAAAGLKGVEVLARDYAREEQARADDALLAADRDFELWKTEYMKNNRGRDALSAQADFAAAYEAISARAMENFGGRENEVFRAGLRQRLDARGLQAVAQGGRYQLAQDEAWRKSQWQAQLADFGRQVENNAHDPDFLDFAAEQLLQSWEAKNPGLDPGAARAQIMSLRDRGRMDALIASGSHDEARALLAGKGGRDGIGGDSLPGLTAAQKDAYRAKIEAGERRAASEARAAEEAALARNIQDVVSSLSGLDPEQRRIAVYSRVEQISDPEKRKSALALANRELEFQERKQKAQRAFAISSLVRQSRSSGDDPAEAETRVLQSGLNEEDQKEALKRIRGEVGENELNMRALSALRRQIDEAQRNGAPMDDDAIFRFYQKNMLTEAQLHDALKYRDEGGKTGQVTQSEVHNIWRDLQGANGKKARADDAPAGLYAAVRQLLPDGRRPTHNDIRAAVAQALVEGTVRGWLWDSTYTRAEAMAKGLMKEWEPGRTTLAMNGEGEYERVY